MTSGYGHRRGHCTGRPEQLPRAEWCDLCALEQCAHCGDLIEGERQHCDGAIGEAVGICHTDDDCAKHEDAPAGHGEACDYGSAHPLTTCAEQAREHAADYADWRYEVENGDTRLGYADWLTHRAEPDDYARRHLTAQERGEAPYAGGLCKNCGQAITVRGQACDRAHGAQCTPEPITTTVERYALAALEIGVGDGSDHDFGLGALNVNTDPGDDILGTHNVATFTLADGRAFRLTARAVQVCAACGNDTEPDITLRADRMPAGFDSRGYCGPCAGAAPLPREAR